MSGRGTLLWVWAVTISWLVVGEIVIAVAGKGDALMLYNAAIVAPIMSVFASLAAVVATVRTSPKNGNGESK